MEGISKTPSLHAKLMSPERCRRGPDEIVRAAAARQARAEQSRVQLDRERRAKVAKAR